ncbi:MAG: T9SS type A sorting domain-containing protein [Ignavibacteriales bacterium]|nr:T9SS type A sorting domain-containing protein [Ignavibacteriales bacterium]
MKIQLTKSILIISLFLISSLKPQVNNPMDFTRWNKLDINKVATVFNNAGMLCDGNNQNSNLARSPSFQYPQGSGKDYGTCIAVVVGAPYPQDPDVVGGVNPNNYPYLDGTMDEGPADFWNEEHFAPYQEFTNPTSACISTDPNSWPQTWPTSLPNYYPVNGISADVITNNNLPTVPILFDPETGWPGAGSDGKKLADQESLSFMFGWGGTDQIGSGNSQTRWLRTQMMMRSMAWEGSLYESFIVWMFIVRNPTDKPIVDMSLGVHADFGFFPSFIPGIGQDDDRHYYDPNLQLAYGWDDNDYEENPIGGGGISGEEIAWAGVLALRMPGGDGKVKTYDAAHFWEGQTSNSGSGGDPEMYYKWNLLNEDDPHDSNGDGVDDDFDKNGVPDAQEGGIGYFVGTGADGLQVIGSDKFTLQPGEMDTLLFATVFGATEEEIKTNSQRALTLFKNNWKPIKAPPAPIVESFTNDKKVTLIWGTDSENDPKFEGYKVYRSQDNGQSWGSESFADFQGGIHYIPLAQYDLENGLKGYYQSLPEYAWYYLGDDKWNTLRFVVKGDSLEGFDLGNHKLTYFEDGDTVNVYVDRTVLNGVEYRYYISAYDSGNGIIGPLENSASSKPNEFNNTVSVRPELPLAEDKLGNVRVIPNPYIISALWETSWNEHLLQFTGLSNQATIKIFNSSGELIKTLNKENDSSILEWNLKNEYEQQVAPGVYFYHINTPIGTTTGKFFVIL